MDPFRKTIQRTLKLYSILQILSSAGLIRRTWEVFCIYGFICCIFLDNPSVFEHNSIAMKGRVSCLLYCRELPDGERKYTASAEVHPGAVA